jgi:hypothetical protein
MSFIERLRAETCPASDEIEGLLLYADDRTSDIVERLEAQSALFAPLEEPGFIKKFRQESHQYW